jgi:hypothetical protein
MSKYIVLLFVSLIFVACNCNKDVQTDKTCFEVAKTKRIYVVTCPNSQHVLVEREKYWLCACPGSINIPPAPSATPETKTELY